MTVVYNVGDSVVGAFDYVVDKYGEFSFTDLVHCRRDYDLVGS